MGLYRVFQGIHRVYISRLFADFTGLQSPSNRLPSASFASSNSRSSSSTPVKIRTGAASRTRRAHSRDDRLGEFARRRMKTTLGMDRFVRLIMVNGGECVID